MLSEDTPHRILRRLAEGPRGEAPPPAAIVVVAHPDDETVGAGGRLSWLRPAVILHVTDGAPRNLADAHRSGFGNAAAYAAQRQKELTAALAVAGLEASRVQSLGISDQGASAAMAEIARSLARIFGSRRPELVLTHPYEGGHPDHDATAFAVHAACRLLLDAGAAAPAIVEMSSYFNAGGQMRTGDFLPASSRNERIAATLSSEEQAQKRAMLDCFTTQAGILSNFGVDREHYRIAPTYRFDEPPHDGMLFYEMFDWGMTGPRWRALAQEALATLALADQR